VTPRAPSPERDDDGREAVEDTVKEALEKLRVAIEAQVRAEMNGSQPPKAEAPAPAEAPLSAAAAARRLGVSKDFLYRWAREGRLPFARRVGGRVIFLEKELERWLSKRSAAR
jgi:excisionase family DNA binding protein